MAEKYLPQSGESAGTVAFVEKRIPGYTYRLDVDRNRIAGMTDKAAAVLQAVYLMLSVERFKYPIYSYNYGVELEDMIGRPKDYVMSEVKRRITDALLQDDRINGVDNWSFETSKKAVTAAFTVHTIYGDMYATKEVGL